MGLFVGYFADGSELRASDLIAVYAAVLTLNAILLAVCWSAFAKIFEVLGDADFGPWLRRRKMDGYYGFYVEYIHLVQMVAVLTVAAALVLSITTLNSSTLARISLGAVVASTCYAGWWASGCVRIMQELAEHRAAYKQSKEEVHEIDRSGTR